MLKSIPPTITQAWRLSEGAPTQGPGEASGKKGIQNTW